MNVRSASNWRHAFIKAPLAAGLALALGSGLAGSTVSAAPSIRTDAPPAVRNALRFGEPSELLASRVITWENDPWARGGYAVFDCQFDPALRQCLARPAGRVLFAGEHTHERWQGYMNGAIESGLRAAAEVRALVRRSRR